MKKISIIIKICVYLAVFFIGYATPKFIFATVQDGLVATIRNIPQRGIFPDVNSNGNLKVVPTYDSVLKNIKENYYKDIDPTEITYSGINGMLVAFDDPYTHFLEPDKYKKMREDNEGNFSGIGAILQNNKLGQVLVKETIPDAPAVKAGVMAGDIITYVDGVPCAGRDLDDVVKGIRGEEGTSVKLTIIRGESKTPIDISVTRAIVTTVNVTSKMLDEKNGIGYIKLNQFNQLTDTDINKALYELENNNLKGLIFDLRGNPGGLLDMAVNISSRFVDKGAVVIIQDRGGRKQNIMVDQSLHNHKIYPLVILVNGYSASASEIVSGAIKDHEAGTIVGSTTFGKGLVQSLVPLLDGSAVSITTAKYFTPNGIDIHKKGIEPDYFVKESENYNSEKPETDLQLKAAEEIMLVKLGINKEDTLDQLKQTSLVLKEESEKEAERLKKKKQK